jgi:hypothetical protein
MVFKVENWPEYEIGPRRRGSLTSWIEDADTGPLADFLTRRPRSRQGFRHPDHADGSRGVAANEGLMTVISMMDLPISAPDPSTISPRPVTLPVTQPASVPRGPLRLLIDRTCPRVYGAGQGLEAKHGANRIWRSMPTTA